MPKFPELLQARAPAGTAFALDRLAREEGRKASDLIREAVLERLAERRQEAA